MTVVTLSFVLFPALAAAGLAVSMKDWRLPALGIVLAIGAVMLASSMYIGGFRRLMPLATGAGIAGLALVSLAIWRPAAPVGIRLAAGVVPATVAHLTYLLFAMAQR